MFTQRPTSCDHRCGIYGAKVEGPQCRAAGSCRILGMDFGEYSFHAVSILEDGCGRRLGAV